MYNKDAEFRTWLVEERMINPETISKEQSRREFAKFVEDYNTGMSYYLDLLLTFNYASATLPHKKYYDMAAYERQMNMLRAGETLPPEEEVYDPNKDLAAHSSKLKRPAAERESYLSREQLMDLRRVQNERIEV